MSNIGNVIGAGRAKGFARLNPGGWAAATALGLSALTGSAPVFAGTSNLDVVVQSALTPPPLPQVVSPSASTCTFPTLVKGCATGAYSVDIKNPSSGNVSNAWFHASTYVLDGTGAQTSLKAQFLVAPNCTKSADSTTIACNIGNVPSGGTIPQFIVTIHSPLVPANGHQIKLVWDIPSGQGASGSLSPVSSSTALSQTSLTLIGDRPTPTKATTRSWVTAANELYTGDTDIASSTNLGTVKAFLPKPPTTKVATLATEVKDTICSSDYKKCIEFTLDIPGTFKDPGDTDGSSLLKLTLRRDAKTVQNGAKVANAYLTYTNTTAAACYAPDGSTTILCTGIEVLDCSAVPSPGGSMPAGKPWAAIDIVGYFANVPEQYKRCITSKTEAKRGAEAGDHVVEIVATENGRFSW